MYELIAPEIIANGIGIVTHVLRKCYNQVYGGCKCIAVTAAELWDIVGALASSWHHFERDVCVRIAPDFAAWRLRGAEYDLCGGGDNMPVDWAICSIAADCAAARDFGRWLVSGCEQYEHNEHVRFEPIFAAWRSIGAARGQFRGRANRAQASRQLQLLTTFALAECALQPPVQSQHRRRHSAALAALAAHSTAALCRLGRRARRFVPFRAVSRRFVPFRDVSCRFVPFRDVSCRFATLRAVSRRLVPFRDVSCRFATFRALTFDAATQRRRRRRWRWSEGEWRQQAQPANERRGTAEAGQQQRERWHGRRRGDGGR